MTKLIHLCFFTEAKREEAALEPRAFSVVRFYQMTGYFAEGVSFMVHIPTMAGNSIYFKPCLCFHFLPPH